MEYLGLILTLAASFKVWLFIAIAYLIGAIPFGVLVGKYFCKVDIRTTGSGNIGAANAFRTLGVIPGIIVLLGDAAKGGLPVYFTWRFLGFVGSFANVEMSESAAHILQVLVGLAAILGHNYSCFLKFKGGKGIATSAGVFVVLSWKACLGALVVWVSAVSLTRFSSVGSLSAALALPVLLWKFHAPFSHIVFGVLASLFAFVKHKDNIKRLIRGEENKLF